jgi:hypothetical protein
MFARGPGTVRIQATIWQPTGVEDGEVDDCWVEEWLPDGLEKSP